MVVADLADTYGVRLWHPDTAAMAWPELRDLILGLLAADTRLSRTLTALPG